MVTWVYLKRIPKCFKEIPRKIPCITKNVLQEIGKPIDEERTLKKRIHRRRAPISPNIHQPFIQSTIFIPFIHFNIHHLLISFIQTIIQQYIDVLQEACQLFRKAYLPTYQPKRTPMWQL